MSATVYEPGDGERISVGPSELVIKADGDATGGTFFLSESTIAAGFPGPPPHVHDRIHDMFYVLEGTLTMLVGDKTRELGPGSFACVPPGTVHTFSNPSDAPVRILNFNTPAGFEVYMRELGAAAASGELTPERIGQIASRHDFRAV
jgi:mannose-6-phosphate isomerase-like protein (cupin superfamily)